MASLYLHFLVIIWAVHIMVNCQSEQGQELSAPQRALLYGRPRSFDRAANASKTSFSDEEKSLLLRLHNAYRSMVQPPAKSMRELVWDDDLEAYARQHSQACTGGHSARSMVKVWSPLVSEQWRDMAENLYWSYGDRYSIEEAVWMFWEEGSGYNIVNHTCTHRITCGHYKALVLESSWRVGCSINQCESFSDNPYPGPAMFMTCNYNGRYFATRPYTVGEPCSGCNRETVGFQFANCRNRLCVTSQQVRQGTGFDGNTTLIGLQYSDFTTSEVHTRDLTETTSSPTPSTTASIEGTTTTTYSPTTTSTQATTTTTTMAPKTTTTRRSTTTTPEATTTTIETTTTMPTTTTTTIPETTMKWRGTTTTMPATTTTEKRTTTTAPPTTTTIMPEATTTMQKTTTTIPPTTTTILRTTTTMPPTTTTVKRTTTTMSATTTTMQKTTTTMPETTTTMQTTTTMPVTTTTGIPTTTSTTPTTTPQPTTTTLPITTTTTPTPTTAVSLMPATFYTVAIKTPKPDDAGSGTGWPGFPVGQDGGFNDAHSIWNDPFKRQVYVVTCLFLFLLRHVCSYT